MIHIDPPYLMKAAKPLNPLNELGISEKPYYRTADVCKVLGVSPDLFRWRLRAGKYPVLGKRDGRGRLFSLEDLRLMAE